MNWNGSWFYIGHFTHPRFKRVWKNTELVIKLIYSSIQINKNEINISFCQRFFSRYAKKAVESALTTQCRLLYLLSWSKTNGGICPCREISDIDNIIITPWILSTGCVSPSSTSSKTCSIVITVLTNKSLWKMSRHTHAGKIRPYENGRRGFIKRFY